MTDYDALAKTLDDASRNATPVSQLTDAHPDLGLTDAYKIMAALIRRRIDRGERRMGVKMGLTSRAKMIQVNVDEVIWGVLTDGMLVPEGEALDLGRFIHPRVEPEIACLLKKPLAGEVDAVTAADAIEAVAPAMEIIDSRYENF
jgi:2-oxo-3-hexenedioate decarboxylase